MKQKLKILTLFTVIFCMSFIPEWYPDLFGDWSCSGGLHEYVEGKPDIHEGCKYTLNTHAPTRHWGFRHWIWALAALTMTVWTVVDLLLEENKNK